MPGQANLAQIVQHLSNRLRHVENRIKNLERDRDADRARIRDLQAELSRRETRPHGMIDDRSRRTEA